MLRLESNYEVFKQKQSIRGFLHSYSLHNRRWRQFVSTPSVPTGTQTDG